MGGQIYPINCFITPCCFHLTLKCAIEQSGKMVNIKGQPHSHGWYSIWAYFILRCGVSCWWSKFEMNELYQIHDTHGRPKNCWEHLLFPITLTRACCVKSQLHRLMSHVPIDGPSTRPNTHRAPFMTWQARTPVAWHIPLEDWAPGPPQCYSEADECWSVSSPPWAKDAHGSLPPAITTMVRRYGHWGSYHKRLLLLRLFWVADGDSSTFRQEAKALHQRGGVMLCWGIYAIQNEGRLVWYHRVFCFLASNLFSRNVVLWNSWQLCRFFLASTESSRAVILWAFHRLKRGI